MKFSCEKALLQTAILTASRAVSAKSTIPALEGLLLEADASGTVFVTGYNQETGIRSAVQADVMEAGSMVLPARLFGEIVRKMADDTLVFQEEKLKVHISCGMSEFDLMGIDPEDFPELPTVEYQNSLEIQEQILRSMIGQTLFAVSADESRPVHTGSLFVVDDDGLTMVAVDGFRLALRREQVASKNGSFEFVVPGASLSEVEKICRETDEFVSIHQAAATSSLRSAPPSSSPAGWKGSSWPGVRPSPGTTPSRSPPAPSSCCPASTGCPSSSARSSKAPSAASSAMARSTSPPRPPLAPPMTAALWRAAATAWRSASTTST